MAVSTRALTPQAVQVAVPKAVLQQLCHKSKPAWPAPRFNKISRTGEAPRYGCTIVFPKSRAKVSKKAGPQPTAGTRTWQLQESEDVWDNIQDAQNAAALKALFQLMPGLTDEYQLKTPFRCGAVSCACVQLCVRACLLAANLSRVNLLACSGIR